MKLQDQVIGLEAAKRLKELGVVQESYFWWNVEGDEYERLVYRYGDSGGDFSAFTVAELGVMLPSGYPTLFYEERWITGPNIEGGFRTGNTEAEARCNCLIHLLDSSLISVDEVNKRLTL